MTETDRTARRYDYVGPQAILERVQGQPPGTLITTADDLMAFVRLVGDERTVTYTIGEAGQLRCADRHSEHVACAGFAPVLAAGEMTILIERGEIEILSVTNQSTGYCPEPSCWPSVEAALAHLGIASPDGFSVAFDFRRCKSCNAINIVKDGWLECACGVPLPAEWNFG